MLSPRYVIATQITALANWLQRRQAPAPQRIWIATDPDHTARATLLARIALAGRGIQIQPDPPPTPSPSEHRKLLRDALRLTLWRANGSTGAWLVPQIVARKRADCGVYGFRPCGGLPVIPRMPAGLLVLSCVQGLGWLRWFWDLTVKAGSRFLPPCSSP